MDGEPRGVSRYVILWLRIFYGAHLMYSSLRFFFGGVTPPVPHPIAGPFVKSLVDTGIYPVVKGVEGVVGLMLLLNLFVPLVLVVEVPISVVIFILNFFIVASNRQLFSGPQEIIVNILLMVFYGRYYLPLARPIAPARPLWNARAADLRIP